jgi:hypothetical protein
MKKLITMLCFVLFALSTYAQGPTSRAVTQTGTITTGVTINANAGVITTVSSTLATGTSAAFTVTNSAVEAGSVIVVSVQGYAGTYSANGIPIANVQNVVAGAFNIVLSNVHASTALNNPVQIAFSVR